MSENDEILSPERSATTDYCEAPPTGVPARRMDDLTCMRALFAAWVFAYHLHLQLLAPIAPGSLGNFIRKGYLGVDGFFILSGIVLAYAHPALRTDITSLRRFWLRRLLRVYPIHVSVIGLLALLWVAGMLAGLSPRVPNRFGPDELALHLLLLNGWGFSDRWAWNYPSWSVSTEWAGYLAFPFLWIALRGTPRPMCRALLPVLLACLAAVEWGGSGAHLNLTFAGALPRFFCEFVAGIVLMHAVPGRWAKPAPWLGIVLLGAGLVLGWDTLSVAGLFLLLAALVLRHGTGRPPILARVPGFVFLGTLSYAFYMSFALVEMVLAVAARGAGLEVAAHRLAYALASTGLTFALALCLWRWVERPSRDWLAPMIR